MAPTCRPGTGTELAFLGLEASRTPEERNRRPGAHSTIWH